eukprot:TRINITY_DN6265_c0_g2_i3.p1 TRINITY_DN6265_c0_g2~~TRINITY_DN6265_c0_g2_i3.p1  ORF type:complete len:357 (-),score=32.48 TRINITY_DN6265_c0_g2_i3:11-1081(-)
MEGIEEMIEDEEEQGMVENAQIGLNEEQLVFRIQHTVKQHSLNTGRIKRGGKPKIRTEVRRNNPELMNASDSRIDGLIKKAIEQNRRSEYQGQEAPGEAMAQNEQGEQRVPQEEQHMTQEEQGGEGGERVVNDANRNRRKRRRRGQAEENGEPSERRRDERENGNEPNDRDENMVEQNRELVGQMYYRARAERRIPDLHLANLVKNKWDECLAKTRGTPMEERQRTTKVMEQKLNKEILKEIEYWANDTIERIKAMREVNIQDLVDTIYNAQVTYQEMTQKREMRSDWRRPLNDKDKSLEETIALMDRRSRNEKLNAREWRKVRDICKAAGKDARTREDLRVVRETLLFGNLDQAN